MMFKSFLLLLFAFASVSGAVADSPEDDTVSKTGQNEKLIIASGRVIYVPLEGGFYGILDSSGHKYRPNNLPASFRQADMAVRFSAEPVTTIGFKMWGQAVKLRHIYTATDTSKPLSERNSQKQLTKEIEQ
ncbi:hypothetical protein [Candidatus Venteria ishoeyi]|uniref:Uncharacterized protein n=1 Tax=Candidatus Venteria ishoeyi TaxID=1899563 RepID=A0A1H6FFA9_9GAMM|nr:hypothetical protein [Candidatus Venteria ishoeyi]SEH08768.1 Uncharacterised protein [Candidatus Venteria ishoeyi]